MNRFIRGASPSLLKRYAKQIANDYAIKRAKKRVPFRWLRRDIYKAVRTATARDTDEHCAYCDANDIGATGREEVDHFKPSSSFPLLVAKWSNLYFACSACNGPGAKQSQWNKLLLRPDAADYSFDRYFTFERASGRLEPQPRATPDEQQRAVVTISILDLNRSAACRARLRSLKYPPDDEDRPYRFLPRDL